MSRPEELAARITFVFHAGENERFAPGCFDNSIGQEVPVIFDGRMCETGMITGAEVAADGRSVLITYEPGPAR